MKSTPGNRIKVSSKTSQQPQIQHVHEHQSQDDAKTQKKGSLAEDVRTIFEEILQTKYLNMKPSSAALLLKENLEYVIKVAGFAKNDNRRFISAPVSESNA
jgi:cell fate regulator YaaT (PSP1 superfamily)